MLLDSNGAPVTLFEVQDLSREAQRLQHCGFSGPVPTSWTEGLNVDQVDRTALTRELQRVILITEHNSEVNASNHTPPLWKEDWQRIPLNGGKSQESFLHECIERVVAAYWEVVSTMVLNGRNDRDITAECQDWIQTGLPSVDIRWIPLWIGPLPGHWLGSGRLALSSNLLKENS